MKGIMKQNVHETPKIFKFHQLICMCSHLGKKKGGSVQNILHHEKMRGKTMEVFPAKPLAAPTPISPGHQAAPNPTDTNSRLTACLSGHPWSFSST